jgi:UDP-N-acetyl-D-mannosaminuronic acid dehydrogenase
VGGFGHIGLPLGVVLADAGLRVALYDIDQSKRQTIEAGEMPFLEYDAAPLLKKVIGKNLRIANHLAEVAQSDCAIVTIGTPLDEYMNPKLLPMLKLAADLSPHLNNRQHVMLRSTVFPGTTARLHEYFREHDVDVDVSFCPERIVQGYAVRELRRLPQIISAVTPRALERAAALYRRLDIPTVELTVQEAELAKLFTNSWRYIQFAISNQFYMIATEQGADFLRIHHAMTWQYDRAKSFPLPGFSAGPCLLKDTLQLAASHQNNFQLGHAAMLINEGLPNFVVDYIRHRKNIELSGATVGILGMAFKSDIDDIRDSLSYKLQKVLAFHGATVLCSDEYARSTDFVTKEELLAKADVVVVAVPHSGYRSLKIPEATVVVDLFNATSGGIR